MNDELHKDLGLASDHVFIHNNNERWRYVERPGNVSKYNDALSTIYRHNIGVIYPYVTVWTRLYIG